MEGCQAIQTWALMDRAIGFPVPAVLTSSVVSVILSLRHEESAGLVRCLKAIVKHCSAETSGRLKNDLEQCLCVLLPATDYETDSVQRLSGGFSIGAKLKLRVVCASLVSEMRRAGFSLTAMDDWEHSIRNDIFADVRKSLDQ